jgi:hypothetical protein
MKKNNCLHVSTDSCKSLTFNLNITLTNADAFLFSETETDFTLIASNSIRYNGYLNVTVDRVGYAEGCTSISDIDASRMDVTLMLPMFRDLQGTSVNVTCKK